MIIFTQVSQVRNTAFGAREGEGKSLPRAEGFRVMVTYLKKKCVGLKSSYGRQTSNLRKSSAS